MGTIQEKPIELIHPLDMADILCSENNNLFYCEVRPELDGETVFVFNTGHRFIQDPDAPRKTWNLE